MERRRFLSTAVGGSVVTTIGCLNRTTDDGTVEIPPPLNDRPVNVSRPVLKRRRDLDGRVVGCPVQTAGSRHDGPPHSRREKPASLMDEKAEI